METRTAVVRRLFMYLYMGLTFLLWENAVGALLGDYHLEIRRTLWGMVFYGVLFLLFGSLAECINALHSRLQPRRQWFGQRHIWFLAILTMFLWGQIIRNALNQFPNPGFGVLNLHNSVWIAFCLIVGGIVNLALARLTRQGRMQQTPATTLIFLSGILYLIISMKVSYHYFWFELTCAANLMLQPAILIVSAIVSWLILRAGRSPIRLRAALLLVPIILTFALALGNFKRCAHGQSAASIQPRPNIIIMLFDALRADHVGALGKSPSLTPHMDALARRGRAYPVCYSSSSWTPPAIVGLLTSREAGAVGLLQPGQIPDSLPTVAQILQQSGYYTACISANPHLWGYDRGFDGFRLLKGTGPMQLLTPVDFFLLFGKRSMRLMRELTYQMGFLSTSVSATDWRVMSRAAEEEMARSDGQPFFFYLHYMEPHAPYVAAPFSGAIPDLNKVRLMGMFHESPDYMTQARPQPSREERDEQRKLLHDRYLNGVRVADRAAAKMERVLRRRGLLDNTVIIILADHGDEFLDHGGWGHINTLYQELVRIPLIISIPPALNVTLPDQPAGVSILDIAPTVLDLAGAKTLPGAEGYSLLQPHPQTRIHSMMTEAPVALWSAVIADPYKLILRRNRKSGLVDTLLFDLSSDPQELSNLAAANSYIADSLAPLARNLMDRATLNAQEP